MSVALTASLFFFSLKFPVLQENLDVYMGLQQFIVTTGTSKQCFFEVSFVPFPFVFLVTYKHWAVLIRQVEFSFCDVLLLGRRLNISAENDCRRLHCSLRDLSSLLQAVGRLAEHFIGEMFAARFSDALAVVERSALYTLQKGVCAYIIGNTFMFTLHFIFNSTGSCLG